MSDSKTARGRRGLLLGAGGAALALGAADAVAGTPKVPKYSITRSRYGTSAEWVLPTAGDAYILPLAATLINDGNTDSTLNADGTITINNPGFYRVQLCVDWPGQHGVDTALRTYGIRRRKAGAPPFTTTPGQLTKVDDTDQHLATENVTGSSAPKTVRYPAPGRSSNWTPGVIPLGGRVNTTLTMDAAGVVKPGDVALAALTSINDAALGVAAATALVVEAKVVAADKVRVSIFNPTIAAGVNVPAGNLHVIAMTTQDSVGESADGWTVLSSTCEQFFRGDSIYAIFESLCPGDYMQTSEQVFVQIEKWA